MSWLDKKVAKSIVGDERYKLVDMYNRKMKCLKEGKYSDEEIKRLS